MKWTIGKPYYFWLGHAAWKAALWTTFMYLMNESEHILERGCRGPFRTACSFNLAGRPHMAQIVFEGCYSLKCRSCSPLQSQTDIAHPSSSWCQEVQEAAASRAWRGHPRDSRMCCQEMTRGSTGVNIEQRLNIAIKTLSHSLNKICETGAFFTLTTERNKPLLESGFYYMYMLLYVI